MAEITKEVKKKTGAEKMLEKIEVQLKKLLFDKKELKKKFLAKLKELEKLSKENQKWFEENWEEAKKIENDLILIWDFWQREVEILNLQKQIQSVLPSERSTLLAKAAELNKYNETLERGFKRRIIDKEIVVEIRKKLGVYEEEEEEM